MGSDPTSSKNRWAKWGYELQYFLRNQVGLMGLCFHVLALLIRKLCKKSVDLRDFGLSKHLPDEPDSAGTAAKFWCQNRGHRVTKLIVMKVHILHTSHEHTF